jgi:hypothetical protein
LNNIYSASIPLSGAVVKAGVTNNFYVAVDAAASIDSNNFAGNLGNNWEVAVNNIRFTDGTGMTLTYSPAPTPLGIGSLGTAVQFSFGSAATANNIILNVSRAGSDQSAHTVTVNATGSTTQKVPLLAMQISAQGGQTVSLNKLPVILTASTGLVSAMTPEVYLMNGTTVLDSENIVTGTGTTQTVYFKNFQTPLLVNGTPVVLTVAADINAVSNYTAGYSLTAATPVGGTAGWDLSVGTQNGPEITVTSTVIPGIANGQTVAFYATGASVTESSDTCTASNGSQASSTSSMTCTIAFSVTANGTSVYIPTASVVAGTASTTGLTYSVVNGSGVEVTPSGSLVVAATTSQVGTNATLDAAHGEWMISPGVTANFTATVSLTDTGNVNAGFYRAYLTAVNYNSAATHTPWGTSFGYNLGSSNSVVPGAVQVY